MTDNEAPERIWLQDTGDYEGATAAMDELTWCDQPAQPEDTEYLRLDLHTAALAEKDARIAELEAGLMFYSDPTGDGYDVIVTDYGLSLRTGPIIRDSGETARALLDGGKA